MYTVFSVACVCSVRECVYRDRFGLSASRLCSVHGADARFAAAPHSDVVHHDGSVRDGEPKLLQIPGERETEERSEE